MNNKLFRKIFLGIGTMCLMTGLSLFLSCGSEKETSGGDSATKPYLSLKQYGLNRLSVANADEVIFSLKVERHAGNLDSEYVAKLNTWSEEELKVYNEKEGTSFVALPETYYSVTPSKVVLASGIKEANIDIKVQASQIISEILKGTHYLIPLRLNSDVVELRKCNEQNQMQIINKDLETLRTVWGV